MSTTAADEYASTDAVLSAGASEPLEYNLGILLAIPRWFRARGRDDDLRSLSTEAGIDLAWCDERYRWVTWRQFESVLAGARARAGGEAEFIEMCRFDYAATFRWARVAITPSNLYKSAERLNPYFSSAGRFELVGHTRNSARLRWTSRRPESRLVCLSRMSQGAMVPTIFGAPKAHVREHACIARGDSCCEYEYRWYMPRRWVVPSLGGAAIGLLPVALMPGTIAEAPALAWTLPLVGALAAYVIALRRTDRGNDLTTDEIAVEFQAVLADAADARCDQVAAHGSVPANADAFVGRTNEITHLAAAFTDAAAPRRRFR